MIPEIANFRSRAWPRLLKPVMALNDGAADLKRRGFCSAEPGRQAHLSRIALHFVRGYNAMLEPKPFEVLDSMLIDAAPNLQGFIVEGAAMGCAMRDMLSMRGKWLHSLVERHKRKFEYLIAVGAGWAIARTRWRARKILASIDPLLEPLAYDGQGFHDVYFGRAVAKPNNTPSTLQTGYYAGVGRALWFAASGHVPNLLERIAVYPKSTHPDIIAGVGLALAYAGPTTRNDWILLRAAHGEHWLHVCQGISFAAEAMRRSGSIPPHTEFACHVATGQAAEAIAAIAHTTRPKNVQNRGAQEAFEAWRKAIRAQITVMETT